MRVFVAVLLALALVACGDNGTPRDPLFTGVSGSRIKLQWYLYQDGARQLETAAYYDTQLHARCEPKVWLDGVTRCTPVAGATVFRDAACTMELGRAMSVRTPVYFIGHDRTDGALVAARLLRAGPRLEAPPTEFFERRDGACVSIVEPETVAYHAIEREDDFTRLAEVWTEMIEGTQLGLRVLASVEGLAAPIGFHDPVLGVDCRPGTLADGAPACVPTEHVAPTHFADVDCEEPVVVAPARPRVLEVGDSNGCPGYHASGPAYDGPLLFRRGAAGCERAVLADGERAYRVGAPLSLVPVERTLEDAGRRLRRVAVHAGDLHVLDDHLFDTATRSDCRSYGNGELAVCVPTSTVAATRLYANDQCGREVLVADLPRVQCTRSAFAVADDIGQGLTIHAIGHPYGGPLYALDAAGQCRLRTPPPDVVAYALGPPIPPTTFVPGVVYSER